tara:strand:- start:40 stop:186 length:147 start_codon:yes stop_codon:yes gene_type:complete
MDNTQNQIVVLAQINLLKEMQIFCLNKERVLQEELRDLKKEEKEESKK